MKAVFLIKKETSCFRVRSRHFRANCFSCRKHLVNSNSCTLASIGGFSCRKLFVNGHSCTHQSYLSKVDISLTIVTIDEYMTCEQRAGEPDQRLLNAQILHVYARIFCFVKSKIRRGISLVWRQRIHRQRITGAVATESLDTVDGT